MIYVEYIHYISKRLRQVVYMMDEAKIIEVYNKGIGEVISLVKNMNTGLTG